MNFYKFGSRSAYSIWPFATNKHDQQLPMNNNRKLQPQPKKVTATAKKVQVSRLICFVDWALYLSHVGETDMLILLEVLVGIRDCSLSEVLAGITELFIFTKQDKGSVQHISYCLNQVKSFVLHHVAFTKEIMSFLCRSTWSNNQVGIIIELHTRWFSRHTVPQASRPRSSLLFVDFIFLFCEWFLQLIFSWLCQPQ